MKAVIKNKNKNIKIRDAGNRRGTVVAKETS